MLLLFIALLHLNSLKHFEPLALFSPVKLLHFLCSRHGEHWLTHWWETSGSTSCSSVVKITWSFTWWTSSSLTLLIIVDQLIFHCSVQTGDDTCTCSESDDAGFNVTWELIPDQIRKWSLRIQDHFTLNPLVRRVLVQTLKQGSPVGRLISNKLTQWLNRTVRQHTRRKISSPLFLLIK